MMEVKSKQNYVSSQAVILIEGNLVNVSFVYSING